MKDFDTSTKIVLNVGYWSKISVATCFEKLPKVQKIAQSGHTARQTLMQSWMKPEASKS